jgi:hypothetical protein
MTTELDKMKLLKSMVKSVLQEPIEKVVNEHLEILFPGITSNENKLEQKTYEGVLYVAVYKICVDHILEVQDHLLVELDKEQQKGTVLPDEIVEAIEATKDELSNKINGQGGDA